MILQKLKAYWKAKKIRLSPFVFEESYSKKTALEQHANTIEILGLGSSFCARSFNTDLIPNAFNLGTTDQDLYTTDFLFRKYLPLISNLKKVVVFYGIFSPGHELIKTRSKKTMAIHHYVFGVPYQVDFLSKYQKAYLHRLKKMKNALRSETGYILPKQDVNPQPTDIITRVQSHLKNNNRGTNQTRYLENIYRLCLMGG